MIKKTWHEYVVRYVYPENHEKYGQYIIHYIGWNTKWDEPYHASDTHISLRFARVPLSLRLVKMVILDHVKDIRHYRILMLATQFAKSTRER